MDNRFESFTYLILKLSKLIQKIKNIEVREFGLRAIHVMCIYHLSINHNGLTASEIVSLTLEDKAAISRALLLLKEEKIVDYEPKKYNCKIILTDRGVEIAKEIQNKANAALTAGGMNLSNAERAILYKSLSIIEDNLEKYHAELTENQDEFI